MADQNADEAGVVPHDPPPPGERYGDYEVIKPLASGGMADIFLARKLGVQGFQKLVVVKRIRRELVRDGHLIDMFIDEAHLAAKLDHPNVVVITDLGEVDDSYFMAMEYLRGQTLRSLQTRLAELNKMVPPAFWCRVMEYALDGLHYAHDLRGDDGKALNLVHRDFTPSNIMITYKGTVKVIDFGVARVEAPQLHETKIGAIKGKISYLSPEQCLGKVLDRRSDVFAAGIVLWELLSLRRLFDGPAETAIILAVMHDPIPLPGAPGAPPLDPELSGIVMKALERDVAKRYQTAGEMRDALRAYARKQAHKVDASDIADVMCQLFEGERAADDALLARDGSKSSPIPVGRRDASRSGRSQSGSRSGSQSGQRGGTSHSGSVSRSSPEAMTVMGEPGQAPAPAPAKRGRGAVIAIVALSVLAIAGGVGFLMRKPAPTPPPVVIHDPPPTKVETPPPTKVETPPPTKVETPPPTKVETQPDEHETPTKVTKTTPSPSSSGYGFLDFDTRPYTSVYIGRKKIGDTPLLSAKVPAGHITLTLINDDAGIHESYQITVPKDGHVVKKLKL